MVDFHFGKILKKEIAKAGITQAELAKRISISQQGLTGILNSEHINSSRIQQISEVLNVDLFQRISLNINKNKNKNPDIVEEPIAEYKRNPTLNKIGIFIEVDPSRQSELLKLAGL